MHKETQRTKWAQTARTIVLTLAVIGFLAVVTVTVGFGLDAARFDQTSGGYEYPYEEWTGTPIDFGQWFTTANGMYQRGRVIDLYADCSTGMVSWSVLGLPAVQWREFSDRAKAVHEPQVACEERGFDTSSWDSPDT